jgi:hypothetical protein
MCVVPNFINLNTSNVPGLWSAAGFTGTITYNPTVPPQYKVLWQSLVPQTQVPCSSDVEVRKVLP